jgi:hypothetical protein
MAMGTFKVEGWPEAGVSAIATIARYNPGLKPCGLTVAAIPAKELAGMVPPGAARAIQHAPGALEQLAVAE